MDIAKGCLIADTDTSADVGQIMSLRSSERRRLAALRNLEKTFVYCCSRSDSRQGKGDRTRQSETGTVDVASFVSADSECSR